MDYELTFESAPLTIDEESRLSSRGRSPRIVRPRTTPPARRRPHYSRRPGFGPRPRPRPLPHRPPIRPTVVHRPVSYGFAAPVLPAGSERVRWIQDCLNHALGMRLAITGVMGPEDRSALRRFQRDNGLRASGYGGPDTVAALSNACRSAPQQNSEISWTNEVPISAAINSARAKGSGVYTIYLGGKRIYIGKAQNLKRRLQQHLWCLTHLDVNPANYTVKLTPLKPGKEASVESTLIKKYGRRKTGGILTNKQKELFAQELWGEAWN